MKAFKKIISLILTAAIMMSVICVGTVSASAKINSKFAVNVYDNEDGKGISIVLSGLNGDDLSKALDYVNDENYMLNIAVCMNEAIGKTCNLRFYVDATGMHTNLNFDSKNISYDDLPLSATGFIDNGNNKYSILFVLGKDHMICDEITSVVKAKKRIRVDAELISPYGLLRPMDLQSDSPAFFYVTPTWGNKTDSTTNSISSLSFSKISDYTYTGKARKPSVTVKDGNYTLKKGTDYTLSYKNNKDIGTASVTIKGKGKYTGSKTIQFKIVPKKSTLKVTKKSDAKAKFTWAAVDGAEKYQIYYSTDGKKYKKLATVSGSKTSATISKFDFEKYDYKFKIRSYGTDDGKKYYSSFSKTVTVK